MDHRRYARLEDEQRYLVATIPDGATSPRLIEDRYVTDTRLRLRRVTDGASITLKLGHKVRVDPDRPAVVWHTSCYLDDAEFAVLSRLPAATLTKRRWQLATGCVDEFLGALAGLVLVEGDRPFSPPGEVLEVTDDERFSGGALAQLDGAGVASLLATSLRS